MNKRDAVRDAVILGALLHDMGKFVQRAQENPKSQDHCHWGLEWVQDKLSEKLSQAGFSIEELKKIDTSINAHHDGIKFVSLADAISAGMDRIEIPKENEEGDPFSERLVVS